jgi:putative ABC transport system substrate-binding protein
VDVLVAVSGVPAAVAAKAATTTIPIVFIINNDPIKLDLVASLNRPGGNVTGITNMGDVVGVKHFQLLLEALPTRQTRFGLLLNPDHPSSDGYRAWALEWAKGLGHTLIVVEARSESDLNAAFARLAGERAGALVIQMEPFLGSRIDELAALTAHHGLPAIHGDYNFAAAGGLMSYGSSFTEACRKAGIYIGRILNGEKPGDLPVQQATTVELVINLKAARALGLTLPPSLLARADEVIE